MARRIEMPDLGDEAKDVNQLDQRESVAFLIGAGFSIPMGYPTGSDVNKSILSFDKQPIAFSPAGELVSNKDGTLMSTKTCGR